MDVVRLLKEIIKEEYSKQKPILHQTAAEPLVVVHCTQDGFPEGLSSHWTFQEQHQELP